MAQVLWYLSKIKEQKAKWISPQVWVNIYDFSRFKENPVTTPAKPVTPAVQPMTPRIAPTPMTTPTPAPVQTMTPTIAPIPMIQAPAWLNPDLFNQYQDQFNLSSPILIDESGNEIMINW